MVDPNRKRILDYISSCGDPDELRQIQKNANARSASDVADAAMRKLVSILPPEAPGTMEHDFWQVIFAFEHLLTEERGKTTRLSRTRQKVDRVGIEQTLIDWAKDTKETDGFRMLIERDLPDLTGEAVVLRHADRFDAEVVAAVTRRLEGAGANVGDVQRRHKPSPYSD